MNKLFSEFPKTSKEKWEEVLIKELKGVDFSNLFRKDEIEDLNYSTYTHSSEVSFLSETPASSSFIRGNKTDNNDWLIAKNIHVIDEKESNKLALSELLNGNNALVFDLVKKDLNLDQLFHEIQFQYIETHFIIRFKSQIQLLNTYFDQAANAPIYYRIDFLNDLNFSELKSISSEMKCKSIPFTFVNAFAIEQTGATIIQQIAFALATGHEYLVQLIENGYSVQEAEKSIHFSFGFGNIYFYEISKIRAFRKLWHTIVSNYDTTVKLSAFIFGEIGFVNKSLKDPYTNLLRQTTEAMSAVAGGINTLSIHPYNSNSNEGETVLAARMASNISLILKDESYFDKVIDPIGGSYSIESITEQIAQKAWSYFQELDALGGITTENVKNKFAFDIQTKVELKKEKVKSGKNVLIGINKFSNPQTETATWKKQEAYFGINQLVLERDI